MTISVPDLMRETRNFFPAAFWDGSWMLQDGVLSPSQPLHPGDWVAITGSFHNNGIFRLGEGCTIQGAANESWTGRLWLLAPPADFLTLAADIAAWGIRQGDQLTVRESFGAYSRELSTDEHGLPLTWQTRFARQLLPYRRMFSEVVL